MNVIFGPNASIEEELKAAHLTVETELEIARFEYPEHRLSLEVTCLPLEQLFGENIPPRFLGRTRRRVLLDQSLPKSAQGQSAPVSAQQPQNTPENAE